jgi:hypothetical protein
MSENPEPVIEERNVQSLSHKRIVILMAASSVLGACLSIIFISADFGFGVLIGGVLSLVNFYWLGKSLKRIFENIAREGEKPMFMSASYFLRYLVFGLILGLVYLTHMVPIIAVILGLASFAFALTIEGFIRIFTSFFNNKEI